MGHNRVLCRLRLGDATVGTDCEDLSPKSAIYAALKRAAWALAFVTMQYHSEFKKFLIDQQSRELSPSEQKYLSKLGPD